MIKKKIILPFIAICVLAVCMAFSFTTTTVSSTAKEQEGLVGSQEIDNKNLFEADTLDGIAMLSSSGGLSSHGDGGVDRK